MLFVVKKNRTYNMHPRDNPLEILLVATMILVFLLNCNCSLTMESCSEQDDDLTDDPFPQCSSEQPLIDLHNVSQAAVQQWTLWNSLTIMDEELGFWMKPRLTAWFSKFLLEEYNDLRWISIFRMTKGAFILLSSLLSPAIQRRDTRLRSAIPVIICLGCSLFKLCQGASLLICSELFVVGRSTVSIMLRDVVNAMNVALRQEIQWPLGEQIDSIAADFYQLCGLPAVLGAIDVTHFAIAKPRIGAADYFHFKIGGYTMTCQAVVDSTKRFLDINVGMPGSTNDAKVLRHSALYHRGQHGALWGGHAPIWGFLLYLIGDVGYPTLSWLISPHRRVPGLSISQRIFNRKLSKGRAVVENAFAMLKQNFRELNKKSDLHVAFLPDVAVVCAMLHNVLLKASHEDVERSLRAMADANLWTSTAPRASEVIPMLGTNAISSDAATGRQMRDDLGVYLSVQRLPPY